MPNDDAEIAKIKGKIRKQFEDRAEVASKFASSSNDKQSLKDTASYLEKFYGIKLEVEEQNSDDPARPVDFK